MQTCIICQKQTQEKNASGQPVHESCMISYSENVQSSIKTLQNELGQDWNKIDGSEI